MQVATSCNKVGNSDLFEIRIYNSTHTLITWDMISRDHRHASSGLIGESIREIMKGLAVNIVPKTL